MMGTAVEEESEEGEEGEEGEESGEGEGEGEEEEDAVSARDPPVPSQGSVANGLPAVHHSQKGLQVQSSHFFLALSSILSPGTDRITYETLYNYYSQKLLNYISCSLIPVVTVETG